MKNGLEIRDGKISSLLWMFSLPAIIGMLVNAAYNIIDRIFVGRGIGSIAIAATTVAFPLMTVLLAVYLLVGIGATALISIRLGQRKLGEAEEIAGNALVMMILLPLILSGIYFAFPDQILTFFGASKEVLPYARDFSNIIMLGSAFGSVSFGVNNFIRAEGNPRLAMITQVSAALINGILNYVFIFKLGMGIKGSALATISGQFLSAVWVLAWFQSGRSLIRIRLKNLRPRKPILAGIFSIGFAAFGLQLGISIQQSIMNKTLLAYGGDMALSALGIIISTALLLSMPVIGLGQGAQPIIGFNYGARQFDRVRETLKKAIIIGSIMSAAGFMIVMIWPSHIAGLFIKGDTALTEMTSQAITAYFAMFPVIAFQILCSQYFQAVGKPVQSTILTLSRQVWIFIPLLLVLPNFWQIDGVWRTAPIADGLSALLTAAFIFIEVSEQKKAVLKEQAETVE